MTQAAWEEAYRETGPLVHTLALRALGSVEEAEDVVRRVFAAAAASESPLEARLLLHDAADRITGDLERRVRAKLAALDDGDVGAEPVTDSRAVVAEADRILLRCSMETLSEDDRALLERAFVHGDPRYELAMMTGISEQELDERLRDAVLALWTGPRLEGEHAPVETLAMRAVRGRVADGHGAHLAGCKECKDVWRGLNDLVGAITRMPASAPVLAPRAGLWDELVAGIEAGEGAEPEPDWREEARLAAARAARRRTMLMTVAVVLSGLVAGLAVVVSQLLIEPDREMGVSASLTDPRERGVDAGRAWVEVQDDGAQVLVVEGRYSEYPDGYLEIWVTVDGVDGPVSLGTLTSAHYSVLVPVSLGDLDGALVQISKEPWDGDATRTGEIVARGVLG
ncbi:anti-sigma factor domain-containing protein [Demequina lignilytica]|uniref:Anti-sigma factor n=1 Tax=Demequina lignilytica TaxID=3051663 RepID=A0AAW7M3W5_9MICO|nr:MULTISPECIES: anti-sigma factor [unclassified Demequina]MDN4478001.1 anti-sigma factor [Demequina sp. SYSU T00039-1]MDN4482919.1 anti-sigma factor [Demequina sp. SYSU T0a273]MDN4488549.1 anti-sigma factor [Demequina sp. SYSU T00039]MDN4489904.1 anti-sigma factor [Demequina sp. SYSU T00068]